jgi:nondiscriminating aspartyl-tRNA synthetase
MRRILTSELRSHVGERVLVAGWLQHRRELSQVTFVGLRDGVGVAQVVLGANEEVECLRELPLESVVEVEGDVVASVQAPGGTELHAPRARSIAQAEPDPPIDLRRSRLAEGLATRLDHAPVALRHERERAKLRIAAASLGGFRSALEGLGFTEIQTPKLVGSATEGGANVFEVGYFGRTAYLAQSPQLYKQIMVGVLERVFETGPVFRAEPHETGRHLAEYVSLDAELGFVEDHTTVMSVVREAIAGMLDAVRSRRDACELLELALPELPAEIPSVRFEEGQRLIEEATGERVAGEPDFAPAHERWLGEWALREHGCELLFVVGYPMEKRPFYTHPDPTRPELSNSFDLLFRGVEIVTGGQRLHGYEDYLAALAARSLPVEPFAGYLEAFRYGMPPHGGFALGLERWVARLVGAANVREATLFPRDRNRLSP